MADITPFAETNFRNQRRKFGIKIDDRRRHVYVVGKTGMGKSTLLENLIIADIRAGHGVAVVDPHGDMAEKILKFVPNTRVNDVIYFNPADTQYPIAFNILESVSPEYKMLVAYGLVGVFKKIWADSWGPRMEYIMTNTILALLEYPGSTLLGVMRMLVDKAYRKKVVAKVTDPVIKTFWADEFANYSEKFRTEAIAPIQNKVGQFLASAIIRNIVGQSKSTIEMRKIMDEQKILIMNLSKGRIGEENAALLGAMMITKLQIAAMSRVDTPEEQRKDFFLYVDEFQNFATDSFAGILSEARKYRLCLTMAHQYFEQINDTVKAAVFGNVGTMVIFRVGPIDAAELELEMAPQFKPEDIVNLKKYTFCIRLMIDGVATEPFSGIGSPPISGPTDNLEKVIRVSRERYARPQALVEDRIIRWSGVEITRPEGVLEFKEGEEGGGEGEGEASEGDGEGEEGERVEVKKFDESKNIPLVQREAEGERAPHEEEKQPAPSQPRPKINFVRPFVQAQPSPVHIKPVVPPKEVQPQPAPQQPPLVRDAQPAPLSLDVPISLQALQAGTAPHVSFKELQRTNPKPQQAPAHSTPGGFSADQNMGERRHRKRKRRHGGGQGQPFPGGDQTSRSGQTISQFQQPMRAPRQQPYEQPRPKTDVPQPQRQQYQAQPNVNTPQPSQQQQPRPKAITSQTQLADDANKISLKDLLP